MLNGTSLVWRSLDEIHQDVCALEDQFQDKKMSINQMYLRRTV